LKAVESENIEIVKSILKNSNKNQKLLNLNIKDIYGNNPLLRATSKNKIEIVQ